MAKMINKNKESACKTVFSNFKIRKVPAKKIPKTLRHNKKLIELKSELNFLNKMEQNHAFWTMLSLVTNHGYSTTATQPKYKASSKHKLVSLTKKAKNDKLWSEENADLVFQLSRYQTGEHKSQVPDHQDSWILYSDA